MQLEVHLKIRSLDYVVYNNFMYSNLHGRKCPVAVYLQYDKQYNVDYLNCRLVTKLGTVHIRIGYINP